jgi:uncharacterized protein (TIGR02217 family)
VAFFECEFPRAISYHRLGSSSGWSTDVKSAFSGQEQRNQNWGDARGKWTISVKTPSTAQFPGPGGGEGPRRQSFVDLLVAFHKVVKGRGDAFRLKDQLDYQGINQQLATVAGHVQLVKNYVIGGRTYQRVITKPINSSVNDFQGNALPNTVFLHGTSTVVTVDATTGIVTGQSAGTAVDFQFHYPARFDTDELPIQVEESAVGAGAPVVSINGVQLFEVLPPNY